MPLQFLMDHDRVAETKVVYVSWIRITLDVSVIDQGINFNKTNMNANCSKKCTFILVTQFCDIIINTMYISNQTSCLIINDLRLGYIKAGNEYAFDGVFVSGT